MCYLLSRSRVSVAVTAPPLPPEIECIAKWFLFRFQLLVISVRSSALVLSLVSAKIMTHIPALSGSVRTCLCPFGVLCVSCRDIATVLVLIYSCLTCCYLSMPGQLLFRMLWLVKIVRANCHF